MELWAILQFSFALVTAIACIALTLERLKAVDKLEAQSWQMQLKQRIATIR